MLEVPPLPLLPLTPQLPLSSAPMSLDQIKIVAVLGAGTMGNGIAHVFARAGYSVILRDVERRFLERGLETIGKNLDREVKKEKITAADKPITLSRIQPTTEVSALAAADFAIEAVPEQLDHTKANRRGSLWIGVRRAPPPPAPNRRR